MPSLRAIATLVLAAAAAGLAGGCGSVGPREGLPPIFEWTPDFSEYAFRPLFRYRRQELIDRTDVDFLLPLGSYKRDGREVQWHLYPLFQWRDGVDLDGFDKWAFMATPLITGGKRGAAGSYFHFWPFGGTLKGALGKDYIATVLFPIFAYTRLKEYENYHVLFPLICWAEGRGNEGWRFLPFYGHFKRTNPEGVVLYDRTTVLWPFLTWETNNNNSQNPWSSWVFFPFYGQVRSPAVDETVFLWPFFKKSEDKREHFVDWHLPFPIVWVSTGSKTRFDIWPLAGGLKYGGYSRWFVLWPFVRHQRHETDEGVETDFWVLPFYWDWDRVYKDGKEDSRFKIWPFFRKERRRDGSSGFHALSLFWFIDETRFEEVLGPFWELVRYREDGKGRNDLHLLFNIFRREWRDDGSESDWEVLGGLFGHSAKGEEGKVKLFWFIEF